MSGIAVVGHGYRRPNLVRNFSAVRDAEVMVCPDVRQERLTKVRRRYPTIKVAMEYSEGLAPHDFSIIDHVVSQRPRGISAVGPSHFSAGTQDSHLPATRGPTCIACEATLPLAWSGMGLTMRLIFA